MTDIYEQHRAAFANVSAYVILKDGERVATIAFKFPRDGAGRLYAYVHWIGVPMVRGFASGGGYDKRSAAVASAVARIKPRDVSSFHDGSLRNMTEIALAQVDRERTIKFVAALSDCGGSYWDRKLEQAGFTVIQAV